MRKTFSSLPASVFNSEEERVLMSSDQKLEIQDYFQGLCRDKKNGIYYRFTLTQESVNLVNLWSPQSINVQINT